MPIGCAIGMMKRTFFTDLFKALFSGGFSLRLGRSIKCPGVLSNLLIFVSMVINYISALKGNETAVNSATTSLIFFRVGFVLVLNAIVSYISLKVSSLPKLIILIGRNTLMIYVVHLLILYGSAWNPGLYGWIGKTFNGVQATISAVVMFGLMILMVLLFDKFKIKNKQLVT